MRKLFALVPVAALVLAAACVDQPTGPESLSPDNAALARGNSHAKATGDVVWTGGPPSSRVEGLRSVFDVHDNAPGANPDRGTVVLYTPTGMRIVDVTCVEISGNEAYFAGQVTYKEGIINGEIGDWFVHWVQDNGTPGTEGPDMLGSAAGDCDDLGWTGSGVVTAGNLTVH